MNRPANRDEQIFADAIARPAEQRAAFLDSVCGEDAALRARLAALLEAHESADRVLDEPPAPRFAAFADEQPGDVIGRYTLRQKLGEGGCGIVYMAEQAEPVRRRVALKVIKAGMDTREVIARFAAERQALAIMDHAGIAKVLDAGATDTGRPYFVMELVRGVRITQYCDEHALSPAARLALFAQVCHAVQHAHQKGVIHRDLKPSNILVTQDESGGGQVKVIDFGIAKATQGRLVDGSLVTAFEQFIGTPVYMSPEQADTSGLDIDTRTDIYSLGVLLYELLAGGPPFDSKALGALSRDEIRRTIRDVDPPKPSARFARLPKNERAAIARRHNIEPAKLSAILGGDLDWIVMKALEKDRARRYATAVEFEADVARHLRHEAVLARPPSRAYRLGRFVRRNRVGACAALVVVLALIAATVVSIWHAVRTSRAERLAEANRARAVDEGARADDVVTFMLSDLRPQLAGVGRLDVLDAVGEKAMKYFASIDPRDLSDARLAQHASALTQIGELRIDQARYTEAEEAFARAYARAAALEQRNPAQLEFIYIRGRAEFGSGLVQWRRGQFAAANEWFSRHHESAGRLVAAAPDNGTYQRELVTGYHNFAAFAAERGSLDTARDRFRAELPMLERLIEANPADLNLKIQLADAHSWLGSLAERSGEFPEALRRFAEQSTHLEALSRLEPRNDHWRFKLSDSLSFQATVLAITGRAGSAQETLARARALMEPLVTKDRANRRWRHAWLGLQLKQALLARNAGARDEARMLVETTRDGCEELSAIEPSNRAFTQRLATALRLHAELRHQAGEADAGVAAARAIELSGTVIREARDRIQDVAEFANACVAAGIIAAARGEETEARRLWQRVRDLVASRNSGVPDWRLLDPDARAAAALGQVEEAQAIITRLARLGYVPLEPWPAIGPGPSQR